MGVGGFLLISIVDVAYTLLLVLGLGWLRRTHITEVKRQDEIAVTASDFTIQVCIGPPTRQHSPHQAMTLVAQVWGLPFKSASLADIKSFFEGVAAAQQVGGPAAPPASGRNTEQQTHSCLVPGAWCVPVHRKRWRIRRMRTSRFTTCTRPGMSPK